MDSKRKVSSGGPAAHDDVDDRASKRRKFPEKDDGETPQTTKEHGLKFVETIKKTEDKNGRLIATAFLELPNRRQLPEYYKEIKLPIALDTIEAKLRRNEFPTLTSLESYFKRMILNAKEFNEKGSIIYEDAERLRKALSNYMTKINPAYKTPGFVCLPTPIPGGEGQTEDVAAEEAEDAEAEPDEEIEIAPPPKRRGRPPKNAQPQPHPLRNSSTPASLEPQYFVVDYSGLNFQQAQERILLDLLNWKEFPNDTIAGFYPFLDLLDPRDFKEYYQIIKHPVSIKQLQKRVKGVHGKKAATGVSDFKHWAAFEEEMSYLWNNAFEYNQDGSDIFVLAEVLQKFFYKCLKEAKRVVPEPAGTPSTTGTAGTAGTKIKLKMPEPAPKITLKFGGGKASPADSPAPQTNGSNGSDVPVNGTARRNPFGGSSSTPVATLGQLEQARSISDSVASPTPPTAALVKNEEGGRNSPAVAPGYGYRGPSQAVSSPGINGHGMPPPLTPSLPQQTQYSQGGYAQSFNHQTHQPNQGYESQFRQPGKGASDAMITNLGIATHPGLHIPKHLRMNLPPSPTKTQQSVTINLPSTHYYLQIKPTIAPSLRERQYKLFVTSGGQRLHALPMIPGQAVDNLHPLFDARLFPGVNRIEVELIAALPKGAPKLPNGQDVELEKITIFANLMKS